MSRYLTSGLDTLKSHLRHAREKGYVAGIKLLRGAYLYLEPDRTRKIHKDKAATDDSFEEAVEVLLHGTNADSAQDEPVMGQSPDLRSPLQNPLWQPRSCSQRTILKVSRRLWRCINGSTATFNQVVR